MYTDKCLTKSNRKNKINKKLKKIIFGGKQTRCDIKSGPQDEIVNSVGTDLVMGPPESPPLQFLTEHAFCYIYGFHFQSVNMTQYLI